MDLILKCYSDIPFDCGSVHIRLIGVHIHVISVVDGSAVHEHVPGSILTGNKEDRNGTRAEALPDVSLLKKLSNLSLKFLCLHRIGLVSWPVWKRRTRDEVNLVFNASDWWQSLRILIWKYIKVFLQNICQITRNLRCNVRRGSH